MDPSDHDGEALASASIANPLVGFGLAPAIADMIAGHADPRHVAMIVADTNIRSEDDWDAMLEGHARAAWGRDPARGIAIAGALRMLGKIVQPRAHGMPAHLGREVWFLADDCNIEGGDYPAALWPGEDAVPPAPGDAIVVVDTKRLPRVAEATTGHWPRDQQIHFAHASTQLARALDHWIPGMTRVVRERLTRAFTYQALYGIRLRMSADGHVPQAEMMAEIEAMRDTEGRMPV